MSGNGNVHYLSTINPTVTDRKLTNLEHAEHEFRLCIKNFDLSVTIRHCCGLLDFIK